MCLPSSEKCYKNIKKHQKHDFHWSKEQLWRRSCLSVLLAIDFKQQSWGNLQNDKEKASTLLYNTEHKSLIFHFWWRGWLWNAVAWLHKAVTSLRPTTWCNEDERQPIIFPFSQHLRFLPLTPNISGINGDFLRAAAFRENVVFVWTLSL